MNYEEIVQRVKNGEKIEDIASEMTAMLNKAQSEVDAAKAVENERDTKMNEVATTIANALQEYLTLMGIDMEGISATEVRELMDEFAPLFHSIKNMKVKIIEKDSKDPDAVFAKWFKSLGW